MDEAMDDEAVMEDIPPIAGTHFSFARTCQSVNLRMVSIHHRSTHTFMKTSVNCNLERLTKTRLCCSSPADTGAGVGEVDITDLRRAVYINPCK